jgi:prepilin-type N-terminal cleavage/methylation domain-containing protein
VKTRAFTMVEIIMVITIIGILSIGIVSFFDSNERTKMYKAETCLNEINGKVKNFTNSALTSKQLRIGTEQRFPDYYLINFQTGAGNIVFKYITGTAETIYETLSLSTGCTKERISFEFNSSTNISLVKMNKGFRQIKPNEVSTFLLNDSFTDTNHVTFTGEVTINVCLPDTGCSPSREFFKWIIDSRSQGIYLKKCLFYKETDRNKCETRES